MILELSTCIALLRAAMWSDRWEKNLPTLAPVYDITLQRMAYFSAVTVLGIKCLGVFSHGAGTKCFIHNATITATGMFPKTCSMGSMTH